MVGEMRCLEIFLSSVYSQKLKAFVRIFFCKKIRPFKNAWIKKSNTSDIFNHQFEKGGKNE